MAELQPHQQQAQADKAHADASIAELQAFMAGPIYPTLSADEKIWVGQQLYWTQGLSTTLAHRIAIHNGETRHA